MVSVSSNGGIHAATEDFVGGVSAWYSERTTGQLRHDLMGCWRATGSDTVGSVSVFACAWVANDVGKMASKIIVEVISRGANERYNHNVPRSGADVAS